jgi:hypothetical protein
MTNATWLESTNDVLALSSLPLITSADAFNNSGLQKYQRVTKQFVKLAHKHLGVRAYDHFNKRIFDFPTEVGTSIYELRTGLSPEGIQLHSFFNNSTGTLASQNGRIPYMEYDRFKTLYPDLSHVGTGAPTHWTLLPIDSEETSPVHRIRIIPDPDNAYTIEYVAKLDMWELENDESLILFPKHADHALWMYCWELLESDLGEGKEGRIGLMAQKAANEVFLVAGKHPDAIKAPRTMFIPQRRGSKGWIRSPRSVDYDGTLLE